MQFTIYSRKLKRDITFSRPSNYYIFVDLNGQSGYLGQQICKQGGFSGSCLGVSGDDYDSDTQSRFERICKNWWKTYCAQYDADYIDFY